MEFFKAPKVLARLISLTTQAAVDDGSNGTCLARNTVMVLRSPVKELNDFPFVIAALLNSLPTRYYAFLMLRAGVIQKAYSHIYSSVIGRLPTPEGVYQDTRIRHRLDTLSLRAHEVAKEMVNGDRDVLKQVDSLVGKDLIPFAYSPKCDLSGYFAEIEIETAQVADEGELTSVQLGKLRESLPSFSIWLLGRALRVKVYFPKRIWRVF